MKKCSYCSEVKSISQFCKVKTSKDGLKSQCKACDKVKRRDYYLKNRDVICSKKKEYVSKNKEAIKETSRVWYLKNRERLSNKSREYYLNHKEEVRIRSIKYLKENRQKRRDYYNKRKREDLNFRLKCTLKNRVIYALKREGVERAARTLELLGCSLDKARKHIENQFQEGMSWDNHGVFGWHVDHIIPCSSFDLTRPEQQKQCFNYKNLQPLWATDNLMKGNKLDWEKEY